MGYMVCLVQALSRGELLKLIVPGLVADPACNQTENGLQPKILDVKLFIWLADMTKENQTYKMLAVS